MSDPVTNVEIEDVLSSIRRLVAQTGAADEGQKEGASSQANAVPERFVLTPALRVSKAALATEPESEPEQESDPDHEIEIDEEVAETTPEASDAAPLILGPEDAVAVRASLESTIAELEAAVNRQAQDWEPDGSETETSFTWESAGMASSADADDTEEVAPEDDSVLHFLDELRERPQAASTWSASEDTAANSNVVDAAAAIAAMRARVVETPEPEGDGAEPGAADPETAETLADEDVAANAPSADADVPEALVAEPDMPLILTPQDDLSHGDASDVPTEDEADAALDLASAVEGILRETVPDAPPEDYSALIVDEDAGAFAALDAVVEAEIAETVSEIAQDEIDAAVPAFRRHGNTAYDADEARGDELDEYDASTGADETLEDYLTGAVPFDRDELKAVVSEVLREELHGPMGERITRNVRRLVRREIHRVLTTHDLD